MKNSIYNLLENKLNVKILGNNIERFIKISSFTNFDTTKSVPLIITFLLSNFIITLLESK